MEATCLEHERRGLVQDTSSYPLSGFDPCRSLGDSSTLRVPISKGEVLKGERVLFRLAFQDSKPLSVILKTKIEGKYYAG